MWLAILRHRGLVAHYVQGVQEAWLLSLKNNTDWHGWQGHVFIRVQHHDTTTLICSTSGQPVQETATSYGEWRIKGAFLHLLDCADPHTSNIADEHSIKSHIHRLQQRLAGAA